MPLLPPHSFRCDHGHSLQRDYSPSPGSTLRRSIRPSSLRVHDFPFDFLDLLAGLPARNALRSLESSLDPSPHHNLGPLDPFPGSWEPFLDGSTVDSLRPYTPPSLHQPKPYPPPRPHFVRCGRMWALMCKHGWERGLCGDPLDSLFESLGCRAGYGVGAGGGGIKVDNDGVNMTVFPD